MRDASASPLTAGIKAARDNALPLAIIMLAAAGLVVAYYNVPAVATALNRIGAVNKANPFAFAAIFTAITSGLIPWCFRMIFPRATPDLSIRRPHPQHGLVEPDGDVDHLFLPYPGRLVWQ
jgi:hypothetical protein